MMKCTSLETSYGKFYMHHYKGISKHAIIFIPGLMESKSGLFYIWHEMACYFQKAGHSCILFDLAGQGDSLLPMSFDIWRAQINAIQNYFDIYETHFIARGIGASILPIKKRNIAITPGLFEPVVHMLQQIRWKPSPFFKDSLTPAEPNALLEIEERCFHLLGAEAACIGSLQVPKAFIQELPFHLVKELPEGTLCFTDHLLFDKKIQREELIQLISKNLFPRTT